MSAGMFAAFAVTNGDCADRQVKGPNCWMRSMGRSSVFFCAQWKSSSMLRGHWASCSSFSLNRGVGQSRLSVSARPPGYWRA